MPELVVSAIPKRKEDAQKGILFSWRSRRDSIAQFAVPEIAVSRYRSVDFDRCTNPCSLYPPPAALAGVARAFGARVRVIQLTEKE